MASPHSVKEANGRKVLNYYLGDKYELQFTEGQYDRTDFTATAYTNTTRTYCGDVKAYLDPQHPRYSNKFHNYQVDFDKLREIKKKALNSNSKPILACIFTDKFIVWDLEKCNWETTATWKEVNKDGCNYGEKEWELQAYLEISDASYNITREEGDYEC